MNKKLRSVRGLSRVFNRKLLLFSILTLFCASAYAQPTITLTNSTPSVCQGITSAGFTYSATTGSPVDYSIDWDAAAEAAGFVDVVNAALPASPITTPVPGAAALATYNGTLTVRDGGAVTSINYAVSVTVAAPITITGHGVDRTICENDNTTFAITTAGGGLTYQWQESINGGVTWTTVTNGGIYTGATTATLTLTNVPTATGGRLFRCVVSNGACSINSGARLLSVNRRPSIVSHGFNSTICENDNTTFVVIGSGAGVTYQWQSSTNGGTTWNNVANGGVYTGATNSTLTLTNVPSSMSGTFYRCMVSGTCTPSVTSGPRLLLVNRRPSITGQPMSQTICLGSNTEFNTIGSGAGVTYQWQVSTNGGGTWSNVVNGAVYSGATSTKLSLTNPSLGMHNNQYRCIVSGTCPPSVTSGVATLTINTAPAITTQPMNSNTCPGANTSYSVVATGTGLTYQWQFSTNGGAVWNNLVDSSIYSNTKTATLNLTGAMKVHDNYQFRCVVSGTCPSPVTTTAATLTILDQPSITTHGVNRTICENDNTTFAVTATGTGITYQWQSSTNGGTTWNNVANGGVYTGATSATLTLTNVPSSMSGTFYRCMVSGTCTPSVTSGPRLLLVNRRPSITGQPMSQTICLGSNTEFNTIGSGAGVTYQWQVSTNGGGTWSNVVNGAVYSGATSTKLSLTNPSLGMHNNQYRCIVSGTCPPSVTSSVATLTINTLPAITTQPSNSSACPGTNTSFSVVATGTGITYQWQMSKNGGATYDNLVDSTIYSNTQTATLQLTGVTKAYDNYLFRCVVSGTCTPSATTTAATLTILDQPSITTHGVNRTICENDNTTFVVIGSGTGITYQWQSSTNGGTTWNNVANGGVYTGATSATLTLTNVPSSMSGTFYRCMVSGTCTPSVTSGPRLLLVNRRPSITGQPMSQTICLGSNTEFNTIGSGAGVTYQWQVSTNGGGTWSNVVNGAVYSGATSTKLSLTNPSLGMHNNQYRCIVSGTCPPSVTSGVATLTINTAPAITTQPMNSNTCPGANTSYSVVATGTGLTYQWQFSTNGGAVWNNLVDSSIYSNTKTATLNLTGAMKVHDNYQFRCVVSGTCPSPVTTTAATLTILDQPSITTHGVNRTICENDNTTFAVTATGTGITYQWQSSTNGGTTWNNVANGGVYTGATSATLTLTNVPSSMSGTFYRCMVSGTCTPSVTSGPRLLLVNRRPSITGQPMSQTICLGSNTEFNTIGSGAGVTYQWQVSTNGGGTWSNVVNGAVYSGATSTKLSLTNPSLGMHNNQYRCIVSGTCPPSVTSSVATLTINTAPAITTQPVNGSVCVVGDTSYTVAATGTGLTYQWQFSTNGGAVWNNLVDSSIYSDTKTATLKLTGASATHHNYQFRCVVSGTCPSPVTTTAATLSVNTLPTIVSQSGNVVVCHGDNTSFSVSATGTSIMYQWQVSTNGGGTWNNVTNSGKYNGAQTAMLNIIGAPVAWNSYQYRCVVSGACTPTVMSAARTLTVNALPNVTMNPSHSTICEGNNTSFSISATGTGISYQWQVSSNGGNTWGNVSNSMLYSGATTSTLNLTGATSAIHNYQYRCVVSGTCSPAAISNMAILTVNTAPVITNHGTNLTICDGGSTAFAVTATGAGLTYQWQESVNGGNNYTNVVNGGIYSGAQSATLSLSNVPASTGGRLFRCIVNGTCAPTQAISGARLLVVNRLTTIVSQPINKVICEGGTTTFDIIGSGTSVTYQWQVNTGSGWANITPSSIYSGVNAASLTISSAPISLNNNQYRCIVSGACTPSVTSASRTLTVHGLPNITANPVNTMVCEGNNTTIGITTAGSGLSYQWQVNVGAGWVNMSNGGANGSYSNVNTNTLSITNAKVTMDGYQFRCVVSSVCAPSVISEVAQLTVNTAPVITTQPVDRDVCDGDNTTFNVVATGFTLTYQWQVSIGTSGWTNVINSALYSGATSPTLNITGANLAISGNKYRCVVTGGCAPTTATTESKILTVNTKRVSSVTITTNIGLLVPGKKVTFYAQPVNGGAQPKYVWRKNGQPIPGAIWSTYTTTDLEMNDKIDVLMQSDFKCRANEYDTSNVMEVYTPVSVPNTTVANNVELDWTLYPNPNNGTFKVKGTFGAGNSEAVILVFNNIGQKVHAVPVQFKGGKLNQLIVLDGQLLPGIYTLSIKVDDKVYHKRFSIMR